MRASRFFTAIACSLALGGCATVTVDGYKMSQSNWDDAQKSVRSQASFAMKCPEDRLQLKVLEVAKNSYPAYATSVGVTGCDKQAVYKRTMSGWMANVLETP